MDFFKGVSVGANGLNVSHLQFADDTVIFCEAKWSEIFTIKTILRCFEVISGLRISFSKSVVCREGVADVEVDEFAAKLNCLSQKLPLKYLGLPLGASPSRRLTWKPVVEKFKKKLSGWKRRTMAKEIDRIQASFLWSDSEYHRKIYLVSWKETVAKEIDRIQASFLWSDSEYHRKIHLVSWKELYKENIEIEVRDGVRISFWRDPWMGSTNLLSQFPRLFHLVVAKESSLSLQVARRSHQSRWVFNFRRSLRAWEEDELVRLQNFLGSGPVLRSNAVDCLCWKLIQSGVFKVNLTYAWGLVNDGHIQRPVKLIWNNFSPLKAKFFSLLAWKGRLKTKGLLHKLGILVSDDALRCILCHESSESTEHIMIHCPFVWRIWSHFAVWWGFQWATRSSIEDFLLWWMGWKFKKKVNQIWKVLPTVIMWSV
ncbi:uncharacterized protein LOC114317183 [Camellia sinensis]|uniref:uncharacterized protein LOC114317183 n=1 Tax=Camellia sinensis TaxID=4442 RepID=UPI001036393F|nr:uncharacterized protein LOC114317183 [Camellia sinensis]